MLPYEIAVAGIGLLCAVLIVIIALTWLKSEWNSARINSPESRIRLLHKIIIKQREEK